MKTRVLVELIEIEKWEGEAIFERNIMKAFLVILRYWWNTQVEMSSRQQKMWGQRKEHG